MRSARIITMVGCHAEGEIGNVITGGVAPPPGESLWAQSRWIAQDNTLRQLVLNEPRGHLCQHVNLLVPPRHPDAAMGFIIMEPVHTPPMSGSNSLCVATVLLETGILPMTEPETRFTLEAPGGLVPIVARCRDGRVTEVTVQNMPSFAAGLAQPLDVSGLGRLRVDVAFGGDSFVMVEAASVGLSLTPTEGARIVHQGRAILEAANAQLRFHHPALPEWQHISFCLFYDPVVDGQTRHAVVIDPGKIDRSPTGTGVSAHMAVRQARGLMGPGDTLEARSVIGGRFIGRIDTLTRVGDTLPAIVPSITGRAWITGLHQLMVDPEDPWPLGYRVSDTFPTG